jgi:hypothetical protein
MSAQEVQHNGRNKPRFEIHHKREPALKVWTCKYCQCPVSRGHSYCDMICQIAEFNRAYCGGRKAQS